MSLKQLSIREGWSTVVLVGLVVYVAVWSILRADWADGLNIVNFTTLAGLAAGLAVAKWRSVPSVVAHGAAMLFGAVVIVVQMTNYLDSRIGSRSAKLRWLWDRGDSWFRQIVQGKQAEDLYLFVLFISLVTFLLGYGAMWFVLRARWIWAALVLPGMFLFINLGYSRRVPTSYVFFFLFFAILLLVRFAHLERETEWRRTRIEFPTSLAWRGMWVATYLGMFVLMFGWVFPASARSDRVYNAWTNVDGPWRSVEGRVNDWFGSLRGPGSSGIAGFASFSDQFNLGGPLRLSDTPVLLVTGTNTAPYLAAHRYATYTGSGWTSEADGANPNAATSVFPQIELKPNETVPVESTTVGQRVSQTYTINVLKPRGSLMFTPEQFTSANVNANVVLYWTTVNNQQIDIASATQDTAPADLWPLIQQLQSADFTPPPPPSPTPGPTATAHDPSASSARTAVATPDIATPRPDPAPESAQIRAERDRLSAKGITANYEIDPASYRATTLTYSGSFPVYNQVEAVYARDGVATGDTYSVTSLVTQAQSTDLRAAGTQYPADVTQRYLQLPDTVTARTRELARQIVGNATNPYDQGKLLETWLRANITYSEDVNFPPKGQDVVDYVLFDSRVGYCEYYASAFIVMARSLGIPTRMAAGFFPAARDDAAGGFLYRERNAHTWPEVYFPGKGWVSYEPTAARAEVNRDPAAAQNPVANTNTSAGVGGANGLLPEDPFLLNRGNRAFTDGASGATRTQSDPVTRGEWIVRGLFVALMTLTVVLGYLWLRGLRGLTPTEQLYTKLGRGAGWGGLRPSPAMTPHEYARAVGKQVPGARAPATVLTDLYVRETYGGQPPSQMDLLRARQAWLRLRGLLVKYFFSRLKPWRSQPREDDDSGEW